MNLEDQWIASEAAGRIGESEVFGAQISAIVSMLRAMYMAHPAPERVRHHFDQLMAQLLSSPYVSNDPDRQLVLQETAASLIRHPRAAGPG
ncbi:hypothetical protein [Variovorax paradoxus]|uniref:Uncharacterized protein n=1 Tax=Variovorax paradoxus TaxID=34073 RepID=A0A6I6H983_VARPD|nr:hypothetical protein [Variovorax paradoxus]QGW82269.1 hypothetical protein GOQ09_12075 [Variovorax paradoxus]